MKIVLRKNESYKKLKITKFFLKHGQVTQATLKDKYTLLYSNIFSQNTLIWTDLSSHIFLKCSL